MDHTVRNAAIVESYTLRYTRAKRLSNLYGISCARVYQIVKAAGVRAARVKRAPLLGVYPDEVREYARLIDSMRRMFRGDSGSVVRVASEFGMSPRRARKLLADEALASREAACTEREIRDCARRQLPHRTFTARQVMRLRRAVSTGRLTGARIAAAFGISQPSVCNMLSGKTYRNVQERTDQAARRSRRNRPRQPKALKSSRS